MTTPNIEKYVEEFTRYISANCSKGGYPMPNNGRLFQFSHVVEVSQEWLRATLAKVAEEAREEGREEIKAWVRVILAAHPELKDEILTYIPENKN